MPTSANVTNLKINELTEAQYDAAVQGGVIGANELSILTDVSDAIQVSTMPTAAVGELDKIYQFIGTTDANYTHGYFYECVSDGGNPATYSWSQLNVQPSSGGQTIQYDTMPTASAETVGKIVQYTGNTDSTYTNGFFYKGVSDGQDPATYSWTQTDVQPQASGLPSQTGQSGKFLTTDGTDASWSDTPLVNRATGYQSLVLNINPNATSTDLGGSNNVMVGFGSKVQSTSSNYNTLIGYGAITGSGNRKENIAIGRSVTASANKSIVIGQDASVTADYAIQLGNNGVNVALNPDANTFKVGNYNGNFEIMSANGTIPTDRFTTTPSADGTYVPTLTISSGTATRSWAAPSGGGSTALSLTLAAANWSNNSITVTATGVTASNNVIVSPAPASQSAYTTAGVMCAAQASDSLTFTCTTTPSSDLTVTVLII